MIDYLAELESTVVAWEREMIRKGRTFGDERGWTEMEKEDWARMARTTRVQVLNDLRRRLAPVDPLHVVEDGREVAGPEE